MEKRPGISIIVPALNEQGNLGSTIKSIKQALGECSGEMRELEGYEIIIFDDASTDGTGAISERLAREDTHIRVVHNPRTMGFGYNYTEGVRLATGQYVMMVPGDNEIPAVAIKTILAHVGNADIVIPYTANPWVRPAPRRVLSRTFVILMNTLFGLRLRYYNGTCVHRAELLKKVPMKSWDFAYMAAILVRLIKSGASFVEVGVQVTQREAGRSKAFNPRNVLNVIRTVSTLFWEVHFRAGALTGGGPSGHVNNRHGL
jgi:glycosyltransferase involved in cell wall biosynthesis